MNTSIYKNLYTKVYKPIGIESVPFAGGWQRQALTGVVGSILLSIPRYDVIMVVKSTTATNKYRRKI
jgi:hypothetical protein